MKSTLFKTFLLFSIMFFMSSNSVYAAKYEWSPTAEKFLDQYKVTVPKIPEEFIKGSITYDQCIDCMAFLKDHNIPVYQNHISQIIACKNLDERYTIYRDYVGYNVYANHVKTYKDDERYIMSKIYVDPIFYKTQADLENDAQKKYNVLKKARASITEHINYAKNNLAQYLNQ